MSPPVAPGSPSHIPGEPRSRDTILRPALISTRNRWRRITRIVMTAVLILGAGYWIIAAAIRPAQGPHLVLPRYPLHLGDGKPRETLQGHFDLFNAGDEPLEFTLVPGCNCSALQPRTGIIPAGESQRIGIGIRLSSVPGSSKAVQVTVNSNDAERPTTTYLVTADCPMPFQVSPTVVRFGDIVEGTEQKRTVTIRESDHTEVPSMTTLTWEVNHPTVEVEAVSISDEEVLLEIRVPAGAPRGMLNGVLTLATEAGEHLDVRLSGNIVGPIVTAPAVLTLPRDSGRKVRILVWRSDRKPLAPATHIVVADRFEVADVTPDNSARRIYDIRYVHGLHESGDEISFQFADFEEAVCIPIR